MHMLRVGRSQPVSINNNKTRGEHSSRRLSNILFEGNWKRGITVLGENWGGLPGSRVRVIPKKK